MDRFFIAPFDQNSGMQKNVKPWLIPDEAFQTLTNAYVFRGRVRKRFGSRWFMDSPLLSRFRIALPGGSGVGTTSGAGAATGTVPPAVGAVGQWFSIGNTLFTVATAGNSNVPLLFPTAGATTATFNTTTGAYAFTGATINTQIYWYPGYPVMGLLTYTTSVVDQQITIGFDTKYAYRYNSGWDRLALETTAGDSVWTGDDADFFWGATWVGADASNTVFFVTNFNTADGIRYYKNSTNTWTKALINYDTTSIGTTDASGNASGTAPGSWFIGQAFIIGNTLFRVTASSGALTVSSLTSSAAVGTGTFNTATGAYTFTGAAINSTIFYSGDNYIRTAAIIVVFKNRLVLFNTQEAGGLTYPNRARFAQIGDPLDPAAWYQNVPGRGGAIDAPTVESISTVEFIKDRLIVFFEQSTWELVYTGNQVYPFTWQQINTELGAEATYSVVPFDKVALCIGNVGVHACNGSNVERIDEKIPDEIFTISNANNGIFRVYGIRDYFVEQVYWTYPNTDTSSGSYFPNRVLVYNYKTGTWALNIDTITAFGYFNPSSGVTWSSTEVTWDDEVSWDADSVQLLFRQVIGGNQQGFTFVCDAEISENASVMQISNVSTPAMTTFTQLSIINHTLIEGEFLYIENCVWNDASNGLNGRIFKVIYVVNANAVYIGPDAPFTGTYQGSGVAARVSNLDIRTKEFNFYAGQGRNASIQKIDFMVDKTGYGELTVNVYDSTSTVNTVSDGLINGTILGTSVLETFPYPSVPFEANQSRLWHPVYCWSDGEVVQIQLTLSDAQMTDVNIRDQDFQLHALCIYTQPTSMRFQ